MLRQLMMLALLAPSFAVANEYAARDQYSSPAQRDEWTAQLHGEALTETLVAFHPLGHLIGVSGAFDIGAGTADDLLNWIRAHAHMLGIPEDVEIVIEEEAPYYITSEGREVRVGVEYVFKLVKQGYAFERQGIRSVVLDESRHLVGIYNGFGPLTQGSTNPAPSPEDAAWSAAEADVGGTLTRVSSLETWWDSSWALSRVPGTKELHWHLRGVDSDGVLRHIYVRSSDNKVMYASPRDTYYTWPVRHTHYGYNYPGDYGSGGVFWDSQTLPQGCTLGTGSCLNPAYDESQDSRVNFWEAMALWDSLSQPAQYNAGTWPFKPNDPYSNATPIYIRQSQINAIVAHGQTALPNFCGVSSCRYKGRYYFLTGEAVEDLVGHEYGHTILSEFQPFDHSAFGRAGQFTEFACDFIGIATEDNLFRQRGLGTRTDFQLNPNNPQTNVKWPTDSGLCPSDPRRRLGHALWDAFNNVNNDPTIGGALGRDEAFRQWTVENLRILNWLPPFPDAMDYFAGAMARIGPKVPNPLYSSPVSMHVYQALFANGLSGGCY